MGSLSNAMQKFVDDVRFSSENRHVKLSEMKSDTHNLLDRFHLEHQDMIDALQNMSHALKKKLLSDKEAFTEATQQFRNDTRSNFEDMSDALKEKLSLDKETLEKTTHRLINDFRSNFEDMSDALKEKLSSDKETLEKTTQQDRKSDQQFMNQLTSDHRKAQEIWRKHLLGTAKGVSPKPSKSFAEKKAIKEATPFSEKRLLQVITKYPNGIKLVDIGNELGVDWRGLIGFTTSLLDKNKIKKINNLYYPK